jgi:hypothetical protein
MREYHVRFCERLGGKFPGPTRQGRKSHANILWRQNMGYSAHAP